MSGIAGILVPEGGSSIQKALPKLLKGLGPGEQSQINQWVTQSGGFACVTPQADENQRWFSKQGVTLAWSGYIARDQSLVGAPETGCGMAERLIGAYRVGGARALHGLNGQYVIVLWDEAQQTLKIVNDRLGLFPFYYWDSGTELVFASTLRAVSAHPEFQRRLNPDALFNLLAAGQMLGERTLFDAVSALPPACELSYSSGRLTLSRYWQPSLFEPGGKTLPAALYVEQFGDLIRAAVARHTGEGSCLLLTGGLDSRWLAGAMAYGHGRDGFTSNTIGHEKARDALLAQSVAEALGLDHRVIPVNPGYLSAYARECVRRTEGNMNITAGWILGETDYIRRHGLRQVVSGVGAELISGRHWLAEQPQLENAAHFDPAQVVSLMANRHWRFAQAAALMSDRFRDTSQKSSEELLRQSLLSAPSEYSLSRYDYLHLAQHRRHPTGNILQTDADVREPFFDNDLVDFALKLPPQLRRHYYKKALAACYPRLANIKTTERGLSVNEDLRAKKNHIHRAQKMFYRVARKLRLSKRMGVPAGDAPWNTTYPNLWLRTTSRDALAHLSDRLGCLEPWVDPAAARRLIDDHLAGRAQAYSLIGALLTAVLFVEELC